MARTRALPGEDRIKPSLLRQAERSKKNRETAPAE
jgi:hypothetical protein